MTTETRGVRNRNPGNIDYVPANQWQGQLKPNPAIEMRIPRPSGHLFHEHPATYSTLIRPPLRQAATQD